MTVAPLSAQRPGWKISAGIDGIFGRADLNQFESRNGEDAGLDIQPAAHFATYYELANGVRFEFELGPLPLAGGDMGPFATFPDVPVALTLGKVLWPESRISPYGRIGICHHFSNDWAERSSPGALVAIGVDFFRHRRVQCGMELATDTSTMTFKSGQSTFNPNTGNYENRYETFRPNKFVLSLHVTL